jgi:hypothetical protein
MPSATLKAGVAARDVSPTKPMFLVGYPHVPRTSTGIHDPLLASALYLDDGKTKLMLIALDVVFIHHDTARECRAAISKATGIPAQNILTSATHTHSGPITAFMLSWSHDPVVPPADPAYIEMFRDKIIEAGIEAYKNAGPARLAITTANVSGVGCNRLSPDGPRDPEASILFVKRASDGKPLALNLTYGMHPTVLHEDSTVVSGDFPAFTRRHLEEALGGVNVLYHNGTSGNQSPRHHVRGQTLAEAERLGRSLGEQVLGAVRALRDPDFRDDVELAAAQKFVELPARTFPPVAEAEARLRRVMENYERLKREGAPRATVRTAECVTFGGEELVTMAKAQARGETEQWRRSYTPSEVQAFRIGDTLIVGLPGELFVEYGLEIKRRAPGHTIVITLANGELQGYIVTPENDAEGGYEATNSFFRPESGRILVETALGLLKGLKP